MEDSDRRRFTRLSTSGAAYGVSFTYQDRLVTTARLANLSAGGCGLEIQMADARDLDIGAVLDNLCLLHADLPCVPLQATVVRLLGKVPGKTSGYLLAGVSFTLVTPFIMNLIADHVEGRNEPG
jgi:c-di-GMP-binding flagellar brake protein YcgR